MNARDLKFRIRERLARCGDGAAAESAAALLHTLGYESGRTMRLSPNTAEGFLDAFGDGRTLPDKGMPEHWRSVDVLFQITDEEVQGGRGGRAAFAFDSEGVFDGAEMHSYLFFAIDLTGASYTRTQFAAMTREINRFFPMPVMILFRYGGLLTFSIIDRRLHRRDPSRDVLEKVTLIKDVRLRDPHRAHVDILYDLSLERLHAVHPFTHFVGLHEAWRRTLDSAELNRRFYKELANWYFWALDRVVFPARAGVDDGVNRATNVIRLITRLIFVWFLKEKGLVPEGLFYEPRVRDLLVDLSPGAGTYYRAILQNLFFATLNTEMDAPGKPDHRKFRGRSSQPAGRDAHYMIHNVYRYEAAFRDPDAARALFASVPFLNGGLFECLDRRVTKDGKTTELRIDGFSDRPDNPVCVPNELFFSEERPADLNEAYGTRGKRYRVRGLLDILHAYKFTITENTPLEEEIALDPELLGQVFENLLASYNPETGATARKQTGSFYTPRVVVHYMVDEALIACLEARLKGMGAARAEERLRHLFAYHEEPHRFTDDEAAALIEAIDHAAILDPACGSGAFLMGVLHKLVFILGKLDPGNERWKDVQVARAGAIQDGTVRERAIRDIEEAFARNELDYGRKLYLIENCLYGVDVQPVAVQIARLRFFISLVTDQKITDAQENRGIRPLPNLETKFVAANTLLGLEKPRQTALRNPEIDRKEAELAAVRRRHFTARTPRTKEKCRRDDERLRAEIGVLLRRDGFPNEITEQLAYWNPYDHNASAGFFDPEWMFGVTDGFDVVIGNPPYVRQEQIRALKPALQKEYDCYTGTADLYVYFYERGLKLLKDGGVLAYISSNKYFRSGYGAKLRRFLGTQSAIRQLIDFGDAPVFTAIAYPSLIVTRRTGLARTPSPSGPLLHALTWETETDARIEDFPAVFAAKRFALAQQALTEDGWRLASPAALRLLEKLRNGGTPLGEYVNGRFYYGIKTGFNEAFVVDGATRAALIAAHPSSAEVLKPFLRGRDVKRWRADFAGRWLITIESSENTRHPWSGKPEKEAERLFAGTYPAIHERFEEFRDMLIKRYDQGQYFWELRSCAYWREFERTKIVYPDIARRAEFALDKESHYLANTLYLLPTEKIWLLGLLNSKVIFWFYTNTSTQIRGGFVRFIAQYVSQIPIPSPSPACEAALTRLVDRILAAGREDPAADVSADVSAWEREIDERVYRLYGLTAAEVKTVEGR